MSALTNSIASRWSGVSVYGNASSNSRCQSVSTENGYPSRRLRSAYRFEQLAGELLGGPPGARLDRLPAGAAELRQRRVRAAGADVAADLGQLVDGDEHAVRARVLEVQVVARDAGHRLGVEPGEPREPVVLVHDDVAGPQIGEAPQHAAAPRRAPVRDRAPAAEQPVLGDHREVELRRDEAGGQARVSERDRAVRRLPRRPRASRPSGARGCRPHAPPRRGGRRRRPSGSPSGASFSSSGSASRMPRAAISAVWARNVNGWSWSTLERRDPCALLERRGDRLGTDVELVGILVVERRGHVLPVVGERRRDVLLAGDHDRRVRRRQLQERMEVLDRQQLGDVGALGLVLQRRDLGQLAVLLVELGGRGDLHRLGVAERALREGREPSAATRSRPRTGRRARPGPRWPGTRRAARRGSRTDRGPRPGRPARSRRRRGRRRSRRGRAARRCAA